MKLNWNILKIELFLNRIGIKKKLPHSHMNIVRILSSIWIF